MDLGNLGRYHQPRHLEKFIRGDVLVANHAFWVGGIAQAAVCVGHSCRLSAKFIDKRIVFPREQVVIEAQSDRPVVRKCYRLLSRPLRLHRIGGLQHRQIARAGHSADWFE
jgi:hypothetical protein